MSPAKNFYFCHPCRHCCTVAVRGAHRAGAPKPLECVWSDAVGSGEAMLGGGIRDWSVSARLFSQRGLGGVPNAKERCLGK